MPIVRHISDLYKEHTHSVYSICVINWTDGSRIGSSHYKNYIRYILKKEKTRFKTDINSRRLYFDGLSRKNQSENRIFEPAKLFF